MTFLDVEESSAALEKQPEKMPRKRRATYPALYGLEKSRSLQRNWNHAPWRTLRLRPACARLQELAELIVPSPRVVGGAVL